MLQIDVLGLSAGKCQLGAVRGSGRVLAMGGELCKIVHGRGLVSWDFHENLLFAFLLRGLEWKHACEIGLEPKLLPVQTSSTLSRP